MARGTMVNIVGMVLGALLGFALTVLVSRWLQPTNAGGFFELIALFTILSNTFELGADTGLTRWIAQAPARGELGSVRRVVVIAALPVLLIGAVAAVVIWVTAPGIADVFLRDMQPRTAIADVRIVGWLVPFGALSSVILAGPRGYGKMWPYLAVEGLGKPVARMALVLVALVLGFGLQGTLIGWSIPVIVGLVAAWIIFDRLIRSEEGKALRLRAAGLSQRSGNAATQSVDPNPLVEPTVDQGGSSLPRGRRRLHLGRQSPPGLASDFWRFAGPRGFAGTFQITVTWLDILLVGALVSRYAAGVYGAVSKLAVVGTFAMQGSQMAIGPQLSSLLARKEHALSENLYQSATRWLLMAGAPMYVVFTAFPRVVLGIFGHRYIAGSSALVVLSLAMLVNLGTGNVSVVLLMSGRSWWNVINSLAALAVNVVLNLLLLPHIGILGAAIAWAASIVVDNLAAVAEVRFLLGLSPLGPGYGLVVGATTGCFGLSCIISRLVLGETLVAFIAASLVGTTAFLIVAYAARARLQLTDLAGALLGRPLGEAP